MSKIIEKLSYFLTLICSLALLLMMLQVTIDVAGKYLFKEPLPGSDTIVASYYMISIVFLPLAWIEIRGEAIVVEIIYSYAPKYLRFIMVVLGALGTAICYGFLAYFLMDPAMHAYHIGEYDTGTWDVITWPSKFLLPVGLALGAIVALLQAARVISGAAPVEHETIEPI